MRQRSMLLVFCLLCSATAAKAEVQDCNVVTALPAVITTSGIWCLKSNLSSNKTTGKAIDIQISFVTLDLNGFTLAGIQAGLGTQAVGIYSRNRRDLTIRNGTVRGFATGLHLDGTNSSNTVVEKLRLDQNVLIGISLQGSGIVLRNNQVADTGGGGDEFDNNFGVRADHANGLTISDNVITSTGGSFSGYGVSVSESDLVEVRNNSVKFSQNYGINAGNVTNMTIESNRVLNGGLGGTAGIVATGSTGINCINNIVAKFSVPLSGCNFSSGNLQP